MFTMLFIAFGALIVGASIAYLVSLNRFTKSNGILLKNQEVLRQEVLFLNEKLNAEIQAKFKTVNDLSVLQTVHHDLEISLAKEQAALLAKTTQLVEQQKFFEGVKAEIERNFRLEASRVLELNTTRIQELHGAKLVDTLSPFRNQLDAFRKQVDERFGTEAADLNSLKGELNRMFELNQKITRQTENLTNALTRQSKQQGIYGEEILEQILENAGMLEGVHFERQYTTANDEGTRIQPDIILRRPDGLSIVVDSKVSLTHYVQYCAGTLSVEEEKNLRREVFQSFKNHIDSLSRKKYDTVAGTLDFILMFTPVENAFITATNHDQSLRQYAFARNVFVVTPSNFLLVVKMISELWQKDKISKEAENMAKQASELYNKVVGFLLSYEGIGQALTKASDKYQEGMIRLKGQGGVAQKGERLKKMLGAKAAKEIPEVMSTSISIEARNDDEN